MKIVDTIAHLDAVDMIERFYLRMFCYSYSDIRGERLPPGWWIRTISIICEGNIKEGVRCRNSADFGIHPVDDALVGETVIAGIVHVDDEMLVDLDANNFRRPNDFSGDGDVVRGRFEIV